MTEEIKKPKKPKKKLCFKVLKVFRGWDNHLAYSQTYSRISRLKKIHKTLPKKFPHIPLVNLDAIERPGEQAKAAFIAMCIRSTRALSFKNWYEPTKNVFPVFNEMAKRICECKPSGMVFEVTGPNIGIALKSPCRRFFYCPHCRYRRIVKSLRDLGKCWKELPDHKLITSTINFRCDSLGAINALCREWYQAHTYARESFNLVAGVRHISIMQILDKTLDRELHLSFNVSGLSSGVKPHRVRKNSIHGEWHRKPTIVERDSNVMYVHRRGSKTIKRKFRLIDAFRPTAKIFRWSLWPYLESWPRLTEIQRQIPKGAKLYGIWGT